MMRRLLVFVLLCALNGGAFAAPSQIHEKNTPVAESSAGGATEHKSSGPPQFAVETFPSQIFWLVVSFGTLFVLMSSAALPRIRQGLEARAAHITGLLHDARRLRDEAEKHKNDMSSAADAAYQKAHQLLNQAAAAAQEVANRRNHELEAILQVKQKTSEERIAITRANAVESVRDAAQLIVPVITQKLAGLSLSDPQTSDAVSSAKHFNGLRSAA